MTFSKKVLAFYKSLTLDQKLPANVQVMNPYQDTATVTVCQQFYQKYYNDSNKRTLILGINPGRLGGGITDSPIRKNRNAIVVLQMTSLKNQSYRLISSTE